MGAKEFRVAVQGTEGAYAHLAARTLYPGCSYLFFKNFNAVALAVREGMCRYGVLPIENNTYGSVKPVYRLLSEGQVHIRAALRQKISHVLLAKPGTRPDDIRRILSHEQALGQCSAFLARLGNRVETEVCLNTAVAARTVSAGEDRSAAAIASPECAELYGLEIIRKKIADSDHNYTRFLAVGSERADDPEANRISVILSVPHRPGALADVLGRFAERGVNLLKIESMPVPGRDFEFTFFIDFEGNAKSPGTAGLLKELEDECPKFIFLGSYRELL